MFGVQEHSGIIIHLLEIIDIMIPDLLKVR